MPFEVSKQAEQITHSIIHSQEVGHHHHADHSLHIDADADSSSTHHHTNHSAQPPALEPRLVWTIADPLSPTLICFLDKDYTSVTLEGPLRPPRL